MARQRIDLDLDSLVEAVADHRAASWKDALGAVTRFMDQHGGPETGDTGKSERFRVQSWECEDSPIGVCVGDEETQEHECVFCGNPEERK